MSALRSLTFTALPKLEANPALDRRSRIIARLEEQKLLLKDPGFTRTTRKWLNREGQRTVVETQQRVLPWWRKNPNGSCLFVLRVGWRAVEFEKGKAAVAVSSIDKLPGVIDALIAATKSGELDERLAQATKRAVPPRKKAGEK